MRLLLLFSAAVRADAPAPPPATPAVPAAWRCAVGVESDGAGQGYRGTPSTPAMADAHARLSPEDRAEWDAEDHGATYHRCTYTVTIDGRRYRYETTTDTTLQALPDGWCGQRQDAVSADIQITTRGCTDLHRGAYWGSDLVPLAPTPATEPK